LGTLLRKTRKLLNEVDFVVKPKRLAFVNTINEANYLGLIVVRKYYSSRMIKPFI